MSNAQRSRQHQHEEDDDSAGWFALLGLVALSILTGGAIAAIMANESWRQYECPRCHESFAGKKERCPHCSQGMRW